MARKRADIKKEQEEQEREVARLGELLAQYKREVGNCQTAAREHQEEAPWRNKMKFQIRLWVLI